MKFHRYIIVIFLVISLFKIASCAENPEENLNKGLEFYKQGNMVRAEEEFNEALRIYRKNNIPENIGKTSMLLGDLYFTLGLYEKSFDFYSNSLQNMSDKSTSSLVLIKKGDIELLLGHYEESIKYYRESMKLRQEIGDKKGHGQCLEKIGDVYYEIGSYTEALNYHNEAIACYKETDDINSKAVALAKTGEDYVALNKLDFGLEKLQEAVNIVKSNPSMSYDIIMRVGNIWCKYGHYDEALMIYRDARKIAKDNNDKGKERKAIMELGHVQSLRGDDENALALYKDAMRLADESYNKIGKINALFLTGELYIKRGHDENAMETFKTCLDFYKKSGDQWGMVKSYQYMGEIYEKTEQNRLAGECYRESIKELENLREDIKLEELKESFSEKVMPVYKKVINFFLKTKKEKEAFNYLEMSRARALLEALKKAKVDIKEGASPELLEAHKKIQGEVTYLEKAIKEENSSGKPDEAHIKELNIKLATVMERLKATEDRLISSSPSYSFLTGIKRPLTSDDIQKKVLRENQYILEYFVDDSKVILWVISNKSFSTLEIPVSKKELTDKIITFREPFEELKEEPGKFIEILNKVNPQNLKDIYNILFTELNNKKMCPKNAELIIVPDTILYYLPFELLVSEIKKPVLSQKVNFSNFSGAKFLMEDYNIVYAPSASTLDPDIMSNREKPYGTYLGFGNPLFTAKSEPAREETPAPQVSVEKPKDVTTDASFSVELQGYSLIPLPNTETEVKNIEELFKSNGKTGTYYIQSDATEEKVKSQSPDYKYLLFATHGLLDEENPMESSLVFTINPSSGEDGFLKAREILNLKLKADLVALSACETGLGKIRSGEGVIGLTRAFMYAGSRSILVSLWSVESASTAKLMELFYKNLLSGMDKGEALREAKISIMKETGKLNGQNCSYSHPFFWAPFILVGNSSPDNR